MQALQKSFQRMAKRKEKRYDKINPRYYKNKKIEPIEYIEANNLGFHEGNIVKYLTRYKDKEGINDLLKAQWYIQRLISISHKYGQNKK